MLRESHGRETVMKGGLQQQVHQLNVLRLPLLGRTAVCERHIGSQS